MKESRNEKCGKCGFCLAACPVYGLLAEEQASPRAKIQLIRAYEEGRVDSSKLLKDLVAKCLMCGTCTATCPSGVDHYHQFRKMRNEMIRDHGECIEIRGLVHLLASQKRLNFAAAFARWGQKMTPESVAEKISMGNIPVNRFPRLNSTRFRSKIPENNKPVHEERGTVIYFTGCATDLVFENTGFGVLQVLSHMGYRVRVPKGQVCCSVPLLYHGAEDKAESNIRANITALMDESAEAIIVDCPTCGSTLKNEYPKLMEEIGGDVELMEKFASKVTDVMSFVHDRFELLRFNKEKTPKSKVVTYHAPCHLKNVFDPSDRILDRLDNIHYVPAKDGSECCGGGGTFFYEFEELATKLASLKIANAVDTEAKLWLTDCPVCTINLAGRIPNTEEIEMMHPVCLIASLLEENGIK